MIVNYAKSMYLVAMSKIINTLAHFYPQLAIQYAILHVNVEFSESIYFLHNWPNLINILMSFRLTKNIHID